MPPESTPSPAPPPVATPSPKEAAKRAAEIAAFEDKVKRRVTARAQEAIRVKKETERRRMPVKVLGYTVLIFGTFFALVYYWDVVGQFMHWLSQYTGIRVRINL